MNKNDIATVLSRARRRCVECSDAPWLKPGSDRCPECGATLPVLSHLTADGGYKDDDN